MFRKDPLFIPGWIFFPHVSIGLQVTGVFRLREWHHRESANVLALWRAHPVLCRP